MTRLEDSELYKNAFELSGPMIEKRIAVCQTKEDANHWVELLKNHTSINTTIFTNGTTQSHLIPQPPPHSVSRYV